MSEWKVTKNSVGDSFMYAVFRIRDVDAVDHSGNREFATKYMENRDEAYRIAERLNKEGGQHDLRL